MASRTDEIVLVSQLESVLRALSDDNRRAILQAVHDAPLAVGEIAIACSLPQQSVSRHLRVLRSAGLVVERRAGQRHLFGVRAAGFAVAGRFIAEFWPAPAKRSAS
jgi:DNA-binding transcriptional ArsR family regulator